LKAGRPGGREAKNLEAFALSSLPAF